MQQEKVKSLKINVTNLRSALVDANKTLGEISAEKKSLLEKQIQQQKIKAQLGVILHTVTVLCKQKQPMITLQLAVVVAVMVMQSLSPVLRYKSLVKRHNLVIAQPMIKA